MSIGTKLSASGLFKMVYAGLETIKDIRADNQKVSLADAAMSAFAVFSLKDPSLLSNSRYENVWMGIEPMSAESEASDCVFVVSPWRI